MTVVAPAGRLRAGQLAAAVVPTTRVVTWQPMLAAGLGAVALVAVGAPGGVPFRLSIAGACLAASAAYVIDDPAAATVASAPAGLFFRRAVRAATATLGAGVGWVVAFLVSSLRTDVTPVWPATVELAAFLVLALAVSAVAAAIGDGTDGAIAGVVVTMTCCASTFLPGPRWLPFPPDPAAPGATGRLLLILAAGGAVLAVASSDPAGRRVRPTRCVQHRNTQPGGSP